MKKKKKGNIESFENVQIEAFFQKFDAKKSEKFEISMREGMHLEIVKTERERTWISDNLKSLNRWKFQRDKFFQKKKKKDDEFEPTPSN